MKGMIITADVMREGKKVPFKRSSDLMMKVADDYKSHLFNSLSLFSQHIYLLCVASRFREEERED